MSAPTIRPTPLGLLAILGFVGALAGWSIISWIERGSDTVKPPLLAILAIAVLTVALWRSGWQVKEALAERASTHRHDDSDQPVQYSTELDPIRASRVLALARACSRAGALFSGWFIGHATLLWADWAIQIRREALLIALLGIIATVALAVVGVLVERWCRLPDLPDKPEEFNPTP